MKHYNYSYLIECNYNTIQYTKYNAKQYNTLPNISPSFVLTYNQPKIENVNKFRMMTWYTINIIALRTDEPYRRH